MKWFKDLKVTIQIIALAILTAIFIAIISYTGFYFNKKATVSLNEVYNDEILPISVINNCRARLRAEQADILAVVLNKVPLNENSEKRTKMVLVDLNKYEKDGVSTGEKEKISSIKSRWIEYLNLKQQMMDLALAGKSQEAYNFYSSKIQPVIESMVGDLWTLSEEHISSAKLADEQNEKNAKLSSSIILATSLFSLLVSIGAGLWISRLIGRPIQQVTVALTEVANGTININDLPVESKNEIGRLSMALNKMKNEIGGIVRQIGVNAEQVAASSEELTSSAEQSSQAANLVAQTISEVASGANEQMNAADHAKGVVESMAAGIKEIAEAVGNVTGVAEKTTGITRNGVKAISEVTNQIQHIALGNATVQQSIEHLASSSKEIGEFVGVIGNLASQTNLLALNAAIEAARAGEQGKGFAVVAEEVRKLAEQSQDAAQKISVLINENETNMEKAVGAITEGTTAVNDGIEVVGSTGKTFTDIASSIQEMSDQVLRISALTQQMAGGSEQVVSSVQLIDSFSKNLAGHTQTVSAATEEQSASMQEIAASSEALAKMAEQLREILRRFSI